MKKKLLIAEDDRQHRLMLNSLLAEKGYEILEAGNGLEAVALCRTARPDLVLLDVRMPELDGYAAFSQIQQIIPNVPVIIMTAYTELEQAVKIMRRGAWDYLAKPLDPEKLEATLAQATSNQHNPGQLFITNPDKFLLGESKAIQKLMQLVGAVAPTEATCLITGESGTGKELVARGLHNQSLRANGPFVAVNCGALTEGLQSSEFFGHEKGSFTGAIKSRAGFFAQANGGTLFLDEIGELPLASQAQLLRALQEKEVLPVGASAPQPVNCRIVAATNRDLDTEVEAGRFRQDLFYRLNVVNLHVPPLREHKEDVETLAIHFAKKFADRNRRKFASISQQALACLEAWAWPGNVRELENVMERAIILMPGERIDLRELPEQLTGQWAAESGEHASNRNFRLGYKAENIEEKNDVPTLEEVERKVIMETLKKLGNNKTETAKALGITRKTLHAKLSRYVKDDRKEADIE